ncbi:hypothetical protein [Salinarimonas soli]|uniref:Haloacid dehalogenase-like hydrolase n=1 Tax=Salinarimonas soli TaxID=1638099 RepID=A0A5B2W1L7_9HYPH|nr:hypothetical protein [Salinarimonas soli]KAA2244396.1 hypothetical protein F0L46_00415 [Salinarimonas soli]
MTLEDKSPPALDAARHLLREPGAVDAAIARAEHARPVIVDFDETLWLRNSTEEYLRSLRPRVLGLLVLALVDLLRPWFLLPGADKRRVHRDWCRVMAASLLMPWSLPLWRLRARRIGPGFANRPLLDALSARPDLGVRVATLGFDALVGPLLARFAPAMPLCASDRLWSLRRIRRQGKGAAVRTALGDGTVARAIVVTDSPEDADLLDACGTPLLVRWPEARYEPAFSHSYLPFAYTELGKRPGQRYILQHVLLEDVLLLCLASAWLMPSPVAGAVSLLVLHLCFWMIYEIGYAENDLVATKHEAVPNMPPAAVREGRRLSPPVAWLTALLCSAPAILLLVATNGPELPHLDAGIDLAPAFAITFAIWTAYLAAARGVYWLYNRVDTHTRSFLYPVLQIFRSVGYAVLVPMNLIGIKLLLALVLARWLPYLTYRYIGQHWPGPMRLLILAIFLILSVGGISVDPMLFLSFQFAAAVLWLGARAHRPLRRLLGGIRFRRSRPALTP